MLVSGRIGCVEADEPITYFPVDMSVGIDGDVISSSEAVEAADVGAAVAACELLVFSDLRSDFVIHLHELG